jgi:hypothetical protein
MPKAHPQMKVHVLEPYDGERVWVVRLPFTSWTLLASGSFDTEGNLSYTDAG